jgi:hypothetical protein
MLTARVAWVFDLRALTVDRNVLVKSRVGLVLKPLLGQDWELFLG